MTRTSPEIEKELKRLEYNVSVLTTRISHCRPQHMMDYSDELRGAKAELEKFKISISSES